MTLEELDALYQSLEALATKSEYPEFGRFKVGDYFKTCANFLEGLAAFLEEDEVVFSDEDENDSNLRLFLDTYGKPGKGPEAVFRPIVKHEAESFSEKNDLVRLHKGYKKLKFILEDKQKNDRFDIHSDAIQSSLEFLRLNIEAPMESKGFYFLGLPSQQEKSLEPFGQEQEKDSKSQLEAEEADLAAFVREKKEDLEAQSRGLAAQLAQLLKEQKNIFEDLTAQNEKRFEEERSHYEQERERLKNKIEALLPGAGTVGLAESYFEAKRKYGYVPYHEMSKKFEYTQDKGNTQNGKEFWPRAKHIVMSSPHLLLDLGFFALPLIALIWVNYDKGPPESFYALLGLIVKNIGFIILALFGLQSIGRKRSLYEEYNHKQRVMTLFTAFKKEVDEDPEQKKELFQVALKTVDERPKSIYYDIEKKGFLDRFLGGRSKGDSSQKDSKSEKQSTDASPSKPEDSN